MAPMQSYVNPQFPKDMKVLVIGDNPDCLLDVERMLHQCDYKVRLAYDVETALQWLVQEKNNFDLVICEAVMPNTNGFQFLERVKLEMDLPPPVVLMSKYDKDHIKKGMEYGACYFLEKPVRLEELRAIWQHVVRKKITDTKKLRISDNRDKPLLGDQDGKLVQRKKTKVGGMTMNTSDNELGKIHTLTRPGQFQSTSTFRSVLPSSRGSRGILDRLNSPAVSGMPGIPSSGTIPLRHGQNSDKNVNWCMLRGMGRSNEHDHLQPHRRTMSTSDLPPADSFTTFHPFSSGFGRPNTPMTGHNWSGGGQSSRIWMQPNCFSLGDQFNQQPTLNPSNVNDTLYRRNLQDRNVWQGPNADFQFQAVPMNMNPGEIIRSAPQEWESLQHPYRSYVSNSSNPTIPSGGSGVGILGESLDLSNRMFHGNTELDSPGLSDIAHHSPLTANEVLGSDMQSSTDPKGKGKQKLQRS